MGKQEIEKLLERFEIYVSGFDLSDEHITRKYYHSLRVMERAKEVAESEGVSENIREAAIVAGVLHDYARFKQWAEYQTFSDARSFDHGDVGADLLFDNGEIAEFYDKAANYEMIRVSIREHNKYAIAPEVSGDDLLLAQIVRDADKLDILEILTEEDGTFLTVETEGEVNEKVRSCFLEGRIPNRRDVENASDRILLPLAMVFDLNFRFSFRYIIEKDVLNRLKRKMREPEKFQEYFDFVEKWARERM